MKAAIPCLLCAAGLPTIASAQNSTRARGWESGIELIYQDSADQSFDGVPTVSVDPDCGVALGNATSTPDFDQWKLSLAIQL